MKLYHITYTHQGNSVISYYINKITVLPEVHYNILPERNFVTLMDLSYINRIMLHYRNYIILCYHNNVTVHQWDDIMLY